MYGIIIFLHLKKKYCCSSTGDTPSPTVVRTNTPPSRTEGGGGTRTTGSGLCVLIENSQCFEYRNQEKKQKIHLTNDLLSKKIL